MNPILRYVLALVVLSIIIMFHELGHFLLAKANGIKVNEFSLGLGPTIVGIQGKETKFSIKALPFGGACVMEGEDEESSDDRAFQKAPVWGRISVVAAGPIFNFIMAFIFSVIIMMGNGYSQPVISEVMDGYPAQEAGLQAGDVITKLNSRRIHFQSEVSMYVFFHSDDDIRVTFLRDGEKQSVTLTPQYDEEDDRYLIGFVNSGERVYPGFFGSLRAGVWNVKYWIQYTYGSLRMLVTGKAGLQDMSGPVGIVKAIGDSTAESAAYGAKYAFFTILNFAILLSANLGVINLLPLPALDGGRLLFMVIEAIRRKRVDPEKENMVHFIGIVILMGLMAFIMFHDVISLF